MKSLLILLCMAVLLPPMAGAQNMVPNPSFETYTGCPGGNSAISNGFVASWNRPPGSIITPDLFTPCTTAGASCTDFNTANNCVGSSAAFHGAAYAGQLWYYTGCPNCKEYIVAMFPANLTGGTVYKASYRTKLGPLCRYGTNRHGLYISASAPSQPGGNQPILITPTVERAGQVLDKVNWTAVSGTFTSNGTERYITIGNFYNDASVSIFNFGSSTGSCIFATGAAYYYIDSVNVVPSVFLPVEVVSFQGRAELKGNLLSWELSPGIDLGELWLEHSTDGDHFTPLSTWEYPGENELKNNYLHVQPAAGKNYYRLGMSDPDGQFTVSNVIEISNEFAPTQLSLSLSPNPASEKALLEFVLPGNGEEQFEVLLISGEGKRVKSLSYPAEGDYQAVEIPVGELPAGIYTLQVRAGQTAGQARLSVIH